MKRLLFSILIVFVLGVTFVCVSCAKSSTKYAIGDSGWDADYGGWDDDWGGSDWDSDWDDDWDYSGGGGYSSSGDGRGVSIGVVWSGGRVLVFVGLAFYIGLIITIIVLSNRKSKRGLQPNRLNQPLPEHFVVDAEFEAMAGKMAFDYYLKPVRHLLTDEAYNMLDMQVDKILASGRINVMKDFEYHTAYVSGRGVALGEETLNVVLAVYCKDYVVDEKTNAVVSGDKKATLLYYYELTFVKNVKAKETHCPNCGAALKNQMSEKCPYCGTNVTSSSSNYTLSNKKILRQYRLH